MRIAIASGKGGTGKTFVATNLAAVAGAAYVDVDVEGANGHLFLAPDLTEEREATVPVPALVGDCTACGACAEACRFGALAAVKSGPVLFAELCHSCGACLEACPMAALEWSDHSLGTVRAGTYSPLAGPARPFVDGSLATGQVRASALIEQVKASVAGGEELVILDCPPGAGCAVVEAVRGADLCLLVTEPTPLGLSDVAKAADLAGRLGIPQAVILNRSDLGGRGARTFLHDRGLPIALEIPYDEEVARHYARGRLLAAESGRHRLLFKSLDAALRADDLETRPPGPAGEDEAPAFQELSEPDRTRCTELAHPEEIVQVAVVSGKGGTGKTSLTSSLGAAAGGTVVADCDVDAANLNLLLDSTDETCRPFSGGYLATIDAEKCRGCGVCAGACRFDAIELSDVARVDPLLCEGCGLCELVCPLTGTEEAPVALHPRLDGYACAGRTPTGGLARGELLPGGEASGKLVTLVRTLAEGRAAQDEANILFIDASPGTGCPVNAALTGTDLAVVVTEPTLSGLHDLQRVLDVADWFKVPAVCLVNKADICPEVAESIRGVCRSRGVEVIGSVPFDRGVPEDVAQARVPAEGTGPGAKALAEACDAILGRARSLVAAKEEPKTVADTEHARREKR